MNLKWASFRNNYLKDISRLAALTSLEELSLENNLIDNVDRLGDLPNLSKLDVTSNRITSINGEFETLTLLAIGMNHITSLKTLSTLRSLMELCKNFRI